MTGPPPDFEHPSPARVYDHLLGGNLNFAADRAMAATLEEAYPAVGELARANRQFVLAAVRWAAAIKGIRQFIDLGCGLPSRPMIHDVAREADPSAVVAYIDWDKVVIRHVRARQTGEGWAGVTALEADAADPASVLPDPAVKWLIDPYEPVAVVLGGTLSSMTADVARNTVAGYAERAAQGSAVIISCAHYRDQALAERQAKAFAAAGAWRDHGEEDVESFFAAGDLRVVHGKVMNVECWPTCPVTARTAEAAVYGGIGIRDLGRDTPTAAGTGHVLRHRLHCRPRMAG